MGIDGVTRLVYKAAKRVRVNVRGLRGDIQSSLDEFIPDRNQTERSADRTSYLTFAAASVLAMDEAMYLDCVNAGRSLLTPNRRGEFIDVTEEVAERLLKMQRDHLNRLFPPEED